MMFEDEAVQNLLTEKQELFCQEYLIDLIAVRAYQRAFDSQNYNSARVEASKLMANPNICARIKQLMKERVERTNLHQDWVLLRLQQISDRSMQAEPVLKWNHEKKKMEETGGYVFDSNGANKSTELIGRHLGMFKEKVELDAAINGTLIIQGKKFADNKATNGDV